MYQIIESNFLYHHLPIMSVAIVTVSIKSGPEKDDWKCYQGVCLNAEWLNDEQMEQSIAALGIKLSKELACAYFPELNPDKWIS